MFLFSHSQSAYLPVCENWNQLRHFIITLTFAHFHFFLITQPLSLRVMKKGMWIENRISKIMRRARRFNQIRINKDFYSRMRKQKMRLEPEKKGKKLNWVNFTAANSAAAETSKYLIFAIVQLCVRTEQQLRNFLPANAHHALWLLLLPPLSPGSYTSSQLVPNSFIFGG